MSTATVQDMSTTTIPDMSTAAAQKASEDLSNEIIPIPYTAGVSLQLDITPNHQNIPFSGETTASITRVLDVTMSPVMCVTITQDSGLEIHAVLKLYDRRFGIDLRDCRYKHLPLTVAREASFESFVRRNAIGPFLTQLAQYQKKQWQSIHPHHHLDEEDDDDRNAKYEAALWQQCNDMFNCETKAYELLKDLQGVGIPRLLGTVRVASTGSDIPSDLVNEPEAKYWSVNGILLQYIPGINLIKLDSSPIDTEEWQALVQRSVDLVHKINECGVIMEDCSPHNMILEQQSQLPFVIDFAQCWFKGEIETQNLPQQPGDEEEEDEEEGGDIDPEAEYWDMVLSNDNVGVIGAVMTARLQREKGVKIKVQYPDIYGRQLLE